MLRTNFFSEIENWQYCLFHGGWKCCFQNIYYLYSCFLWKKENLKSCCNPKKSIVHKSLMDWKICDQINFIHGINHLKIEWKVNFLPKYDQLWRLLSQWFHRNKYMDNRDSWEVVNCCVIFSASWKYWSQNIHQTPKSALAFMRSIVVWIRF